MTLSQHRTIEPAALGLRGRSFTKELDLTVEEWRGLLDLTAQLKRERRERREPQRLARHQLRAGLRQGLDPHSVRLRGRRPRPGRARHLHRPVGLPARAQGVGQGHRPGPRPHLRRHRVPRLRPGRRRDRWRATAASRCGTASATMAPHPVALRRLHDGGALGQAAPPRSRWPTSATPATTSPARCWSPAPCAAWRCGWSRPSRWPRPRTCRGGRRGDRRRDRCAARAHRGPRTRASAGVDFVYTDVWLSMGEPQEEWAERVALLRPYRVDAALMHADRQPGREVPALPARLPRRPDRGRRRGAGHACPARPASRCPTTSSSRRRSIVFDQAENRMHTVKAVMVATAGPPRRVPTAGPLLLPD